MLTSLAIEPAQHSNKIKPSLMVECFFVTKATLAMDPLSLELIKGKAVMELGKLLKQHLGLEEPGVLAEFILQLTLPCTGLQAFVDVLRPTKTISPPT